jgi:hypothetical protein
MCYTYRKNRNDQLLQDGRLKLSLESSVLRWFGKPITAKLNDPCGEVISLPCRPDIENLVDKEGETIGTALNPGQAYTGGVYLRRKENNIYCLESTDFKRECFSYED